MAVRQIKSCSPTRRARWLYWVFGFNKFTLNPLCGDGAREVSVWRSGLSRGPGSLAELTHHMISYLRLGDAHLSTPPTRAVGASIQPHVDIDGYLMG
jgi:hypothetical protein